MILIVEDIPEQQVILSAIVRQEDVIARIDGDEFAAVLVLSPEDRAKGMELPRRLLVVINEPIHIRELTACVGCSIGVAQWPDDGDDLGQVLKRADETLYRAKRLGKNRIVFYANQPPELTQASA